MRFAASLTDLIGNTPLLELSRYAPGAKATILAKCEFMNPYSVKDRPVLSMIRAAAEDGRLPPGGTIVEATSGNTGIAIASQAAVLGYRAVLVMSDMVSLERRQVLAGLGAEVVITPKEDGTKGARVRAKEIGLVDELGGYATALRLAREEAGLDADGPIELRVFPRERSLLARLLADEPESSEAAGSASAEIDTLGRLRPWVEQLRLLGLAAGAHGVLSMPVVRLGP